VNRICSVGAVAGIALAAAVSAQVPRTPSPPGAKVYLIEPRDGATIKGPVKVVMGLSGMGVAPAGADFPETGHHHILVDVDRLPALDAPIPLDDKHRHFGKGQTEAVLELAPRQAHDPAPPRRPQSHPARSADPQPADHDHGRQVAAADERRCVSPRPRAC